MIRKFTALAFMAISLCACTGENATNEALTPNPITPISRSELDATIFKTLQNTGKFEWSSVSNVMVWSALTQSDKVLSVGYKPENEGDINAKIHLININASEWKSAREKVLDIVFEEESKTNSSLKRADLEVFEESVLPVIDLKVSNLSTIERLRSSKLVRYAEPMGYETRTSGDAKSKVNSDSGCGSNSAETGLSGSDYTTVAPNAKASWNYTYHNVSQAWTKSTGSGAKMVIIDTGCSSSQENLGSTFNQGSSSGRTVEKLVTLPRPTFLGIPTGPTETSNDACGHGTSMQGAAVAPRGTDGNTVGIAYNANLISIRAAQDVFLDESRESKGVADAFTLAGNRTDVRVISMSLGNIISSGQVADGVRYAYGKGKMIFCAGGTSFGWTAGWAGVIFPASMTEAIAVTGIKDNLTTRCENCHEGSDIDFVVVMAF